MACREHSLNRCSVAPYATYVSVVPETLFLSSCASRAVVDAGTGLLPDDRDSDPREEREVFLTTRSECAVAPGVETEPVRRLRQLGCCEADVKFRKEYVET